MPKHGESVPEANRRIRRDALREQLEGQGHVQHIIDCIDKVESLATPLDSLQVSRLKIAIEARLKLINKYLPDMKFIEAEVTGADGDPIDTHWTVSVHEVKEPYEAPE